MRPNISVIIPVYNVEDYLERCVESVLRQTYKDYELILVDDGSEDSSGEICDFYSEKYDMIKVIHKENKGPSHTRNVGIDNALGGYVYFLDSDDYIISECLQILYDNILKYNAEISCGSFGFFDNNNEPKDEEKVNNAYSCVGRDACMKLLYGKQFYTSSCNILIKKEIAQDNLFPIGKFHEDEMTTFRYFFSASNVVISERKTYYYYQREGSIMHNFGQPVLDELFSAEYYVEFFKNYDKDIYKASLFKKYCLFNHVINNYPQLKEFDSELYKSIVKYLKENVFGIITDYKVPIRMKIMALKNII